MNFRVGGRHNSVHNTIPVTFHGELIACQQFLGTCINTNPNTSPISQGTVEDVLKTSKKLLGNVAHMQQCLALSPSSLTWHSVMFILWCGSLFLSWFLPFWITELLGYISSKWYAADCRMLVYTYSCCQPHFFFSISNYLFCAHHVPNKVYELLQAMTAVGLLISCTKDCLVNWPSGFSFCCHCCCCNED